MKVEIEVKETITTHYTVEVPETGDMNAAVKEARAKFMRSDDVTLPPTDRERELEREYTIHFGDGQISEPIMESDLK